MATAPNTTPPHRAFIAGQPTAAVSSPKSRRSSTPHGASSPWIQIIRSPESESTPFSNTVAGAANTPLSGALLEQIADASSDWSVTEPPAGAGLGALNEDALVGDQSLDNGDGSSNASKKPAWNRPSNGVADVSPVMGAVTWPALSESTKASPKSSSSDPLKNLSDGSTFVTQGMSQVSLSSPKQVNNNQVNTHAAPTRQRSMKRGGGGGGGNSSNTANNGGFSQAPPPQGSVEAALNSPGKPGQSFGENIQKDGGQRGGFTSENQQQQQRSTFRRGNGGPHPRGEGSHHHNYGGRRDHDRGNQEWNQHRNNFGGRDSHMQRPSTRPYLQGQPHVNTSYVPPPISMRPSFAPPMGYPEVPPGLFYVQGPHPDSFRAVPMVAPMPPVFYPLDPHLPMKIIIQIEYYFSNENLVRDTYLRKNMDEQGWVPIQLIANFKKVQELTKDVQLILAVLQSSSAVEVEGEKVRRRDDWSKWIMPRTVQLLGEQLQNVVITDEKNSRNVDVNDMSGQSAPSN